MILIEQQIVIWTGALEMLLVEDAHAMTKKNAHHIMSALKRCNNISGLYYVRLFYI